MKLTLIILTTFFFSNASFSQTAAEKEKWIRDNYQKTERYIPMRDGVKLFTSIYAPKDKSIPHPILLMRTPYSVGPYGEDKIAERLFKQYYYKYLQLGYIFVWQDVRGKYMSEGDYVDVRPYLTHKKSPKDIDESTDVFDSIDWLVKNVESNNGKVGMLGISYPGFYSTMGAISNHPALKAVSPQAPVTEWFLGDDFHHNGAFALLDAFNFYYGFGKPRPKPTPLSAKGFTMPGMDNYDFFLKTGAIPSFTKLMGDSIQFWNDMLAHPNYDAWWKARNAADFVSSIKPATLVVGGLFDAEDCYGAWALYKAIEKKAANDNKLVFGPWFHGGWARSEGDFLGNTRFSSKTSIYYQDSIEIPFFNAHLLREKKDGLSEATVFFTGANTWQKLPSWPPPGLKESSLYLRSGGHLFMDKADKGESTFTEYLSDPAKPVPYTEDVHKDRTREYMTDDQRFASRRPDVVVFSSPVLDEDITLAGPVIADLSVSISGTDADFVVKLIDVFPDDFTYDSTAFGKGNGKDYPMQGYQMMVRGEIMRGRYRNSFEKPEAFKPGKITRVKYALPDVAHTFKKGHRIMIQVQSSWFPLFDRNPQKFVDIYHAKESDFQKASIRIYHDPANASKIILPVTNL